MQFTCPVVIIVLGKGHQGSFNKAKNGRVGFLKYAFVHEACLLISDSYVASRAQPVSLKVLTRKLLPRVCVCSKSKR